ncbi:hypothetical protein BC941DRAFT_191999 [Chlamydoabsidia padenii]|nr:hypothetical protein BC941DRAFT_191999 [Chlamydoabsidia padenii]
MSCPIITIDEDTITDEELDAQIEKVQQIITQNLLAIDQNFERCNNIITRRILPAIDECTQSSRDIWEQSKLWLFFFKLHGHGTPEQQTQHRTNRPPFSADNPPITLPSTWRRFLQDPIIQRALGDSTTIDNTGMVTGSQTADSIRGILRPPATFQRASPGELTSQQQKGFGDSTNLVRDYYQRIKHMNEKINASDTESSLGPSFFGLTRHDLDSVSSSNSSNNNNNNNNNKTTPSAAARRSATPVVERNSNGSISLVFSATNPVSTLIPNPNETHASLSSSSPPPPPAAAAAVSRQPQQQQTHTQQTSSTSSKEQERMFANYHDDLKRSKRPKLTNDSSNNDNNDNPNQETVPWDSPLRNSEDEDMPLAFDFSPMVPRQEQEQEGDGQSAPSSESTSQTATDSVMTMVSGNFGRIPARFELHYFPQEFWRPPGSTKLTRIYHLFADRPGQHMTHDQVVDLLRIAEPSQDIDYIRNSSRPLLDILTYKRFLRRINKGWVLRN